MSREVCKGAEGILSEGNWLRLASKRTEEVAEGTVSILPREDEGMARLEKKKCVSLIE